MNVTDIRREMLLLSTVRVLAKGFSFNVGMRSIHVSAEE